MQRPKHHTFLSYTNLAPPEVLTFAITLNCNLHCDHCWVNASPENTCQNVSTSTIKQIIDEFSELGGTAIRLTGGEPLLHPDWLALLEWADKSGLQVLLQSNGILFNDNNVQALKNLDLNDLNIQVSLDGATPQTHDFLRGEGAFKGAMAGIEALLRHGFGPDVSLFFTEMSHNLHELPELMLMAERLGIGSVSSGTLVMCGRAKEEAGIVPPEPEQYLPLLQRFDEDPAFRKAYEQLGSVAALEWCGTSSDKGCCNFIETPYLTSTGVMYPCLMCHADEYSVSGVFEKGLPVALNEGAPLWSELQEISTRRASAISKCQNCPLLKSCAGGCMGRAYGSFGDFLAAEDRCQQRITVAQWQQDRKS